MITCVDPWQILFIVVCLMALCMRIGYEWGRDEDRS
jgi:hypothetical protein